MHDAQARQTSWYRSYLRIRDEQTYATADVVAYDSVLRVKSGREHLMARCRI